MKKLLLILLCLPFIGFAQTATQGINYQAAARDISGDLLINQVLTIRYSVISDITTLAISWQETHQVTTNNFGVFVAAIGQGTNTTGGSSLTFDAINWGSSVHFLKVEINNGSGYLDMGTKQLLSVPYALHAEIAGNADPTDELQSLSISGDTIFISNGNFIVLIDEPNVFGCTDSLACNYNNLANTNDGSCLAYYGCIDSTACNYNPYAVCDLVGSCYYFGCLDATACNYDSLARCNDGSCIFPDGCTDSTACNYDALATCDDGSCNTIYGCITSTAYNYDSLATCDDGSCTYLGCLDSTACNYDALAIDYAGSCLYNADNADCFGVCDSGFVKYNGVCVVIVNGCVDSAAFNYNSLATLDDGSCEPILIGCMDTLYLEYDSIYNTANASCSTYVVLGCNDFSSLNYDASANTDDGSCIALVLGCTFSDASNYNPNANFDDDTCCYAAIITTQQTHIYNTFQYPQYSWNQSGHSWEIIEAGGSTVYASGVDGDAICLPYSGCYDFVVSGYTYNDSYATYSINGVAYNVQSNRTTRFAAGTCNPGCTDILACNYDSIANTDDGTCEYPNNADCANNCFPGYSEITFQIQYLPGWGFELDVNDDVHYSVQGSWSDVDFAEFIVCEDLLSCINVNFSNIASYPSTSAESFTISDVSQNLVFNSQTNADGDFNGFIGTCIFGCTDSTAFNYDASAEAGDGSCVDVVNGCTDVTMFNYDLLANTDDGSCIPILHACTDSTAENYIPLATHDDGSCIIKMTYVPDNKFELYLENQGWGDNITNDSVKTYYIKSVTTLEIAYKGISDLTGIEDFTALTYLDCEDQIYPPPLEPLILNVSQNTALTYLKCDYNKITSLDVSQNTALTFLDCSDNQLTSLDVSQNTALTHFRCGNNQLSYLNLKNGNNINLTPIPNSFYDKWFVNNVNLDCIQVDDSAYSAANWLAFNYNPVVNGLYLSPVYFSFSNACTTIEGCLDEAADNWDPLVNVDDGTCTYSYTHVPDDNFEAYLEANDMGNGIDNDGQVFTGAINKVTSLIVSNNNISDLTGIEDFDSLQTLDCSENQLLQLNMVSNTYLRWLDCSNNQITSIGLTNGNPYLIAVQTGTSLLEYLDCSDNQISYLHFHQDLIDDPTTYNAGDFLRNRVLTSLYCSNNLFSGAGEFEGLDSLVLYDCSDNQLTSLDITEHTALTDLNCKDNQIADLDLRNGNNINFNSVRTSGNSPLSCVRVDSVEYSIATWVNNGYITWSTPFDMEQGIYYSDNPLGCFYCDVTPDYGNEFLFVNFQCNYDATATINDGSCASDTSANCIEGCLEGYSKIYIRLDDWGEDGWNSDVLNVNGVDYTLTMDDEMEGYFGMSSLDSACVILSTGFNVDFTESGLNNDEQGYSQAEFTITDASNNLLSSSFTTYPNYDVMVSDGVVCEGWTTNGWTNNGWTLNSSLTPNNGTGPSDDINPNTFLPGGGRYMYMRSYPFYNSNYLPSVSMTSECYVPESPYNNPDTWFKFFYHMYGSGIGTIDVLVNGKNIWSKSGNKGDQWNYAQIDLANYVDDYVIFEIVATTTGEYECDMAIDNISIGEYEVILGCMDETACNYNNFANEDDGSCKIIWGCTNPVACNYNSLADCEDGSCKIIYGCMLTQDCNYNPLADCHDQDQCSETYRGCIDATSCNYDANASCDDGSCNGLIGCMEPGMWNYDEDANCSVYLLSGVQYECIPIINGCTDNGVALNGAGVIADFDLDSIAAFNYNPSANTQIPNGDDPLGFYLPCQPVIMGCMDPTSITYSSSANTHVANHCVQVGDYYQGGVVFYTDFSYGYGKALIASMQDIVQWTSLGVNDNNPDDDGGAKWACGTFPINGAVAWGLFEGIDNQADILSSCGSWAQALNHAEYALAQVNYANSVVGTVTGAMPGGVSNPCNWQCQATILAANAALAIAQQEVMVNGSAAYYCEWMMNFSYSDWYLPSKDELNQMYINRHHINTKSILLGGHAFVSNEHNNTYWSSTVASPLSAWAQKFGVQEGAQIAKYKTDISANVRAIRQIEVVEPPPPCVGCTYYIGD